MKYYIYMKYYHVKRKPQSHAITIIHTYTMQMFVYPLPE